VMKCIILASFCARNSRFQRHLNGPKKATKRIPLGPKINQNLAKCLVEGVCAHLGCCKKSTRVLKIVCYNPRKWPATDVFAKTQLQTFWPGDIPLVLLCIKLWSVHGGGTVKVMKCIIPASVWAPNSRFQTLQGFPPIATNPLGNTTIPVAIGGYYCTETVIWLQFVCLLQHKI
jgi:hypothetical protein